MKFTYLALFCCALWTLVSALPLGLLGSEGTLRGSDQKVDHRSLYARTTPTSSTSSPDVPYAVSLKRTRIGNDKNDEEHWALHFHPVTSGQGNLHILHATSSDVKNEHGILVVEKKDKGTYYERPSNPESPSETHHIANFPSEAAALKAMNDVHEHVSLTEKFPHENCVDFTCRAAQYMATKGHITKEQADIVTQLHIAHAAAVRERTDTTYNRFVATAGKKETDKTGDKTGNKTGDKM